MNSPLDAMARDAYLTAIDAQLDKAFGDSERSGELGYRLLLDWLVQARIERDAALATQLNADKVTKAEERRRRELNEALRGAQLQPTLRDQFAMAAFQAHLTLKPDTGLLCEQCIAIAAYRVADAMLEERRNKPEEAQACGVTS